MAGWIKHEVQKLVRKHCTNNPFEIASQKGIVLLFEQLAEFMVIITLLSELKSSTSTLIWTSP
ncbi:hypothetical protein J2S00_003037 [Caldalkalibacillus uzonensis]|uniref:Uncharacterized protein n=1 Tax=Caldalkalibacillus uzonensis TaxID=353224 RepID=A0ABU0CXK2_9BACI|nr:hypothetical protein [Caldalkalibacillus uzonensis]